MKYRCIIYLNMIGAWSKLNKTIVVAAFPQSFFKLCVFDGAPESVNVAPMIHNEMFAAPHFMETIDRMMEKYSDITTIGLLGPAVYTQKLLTDLQLKFKDNKELTIQMMGV